MGDGQDGDNGWHGALAGMGVMAGMGMSKQKPRGEEAAAASRRVFWLSLCCKKVLWFARSLVHL